MKEKDRSFRFAQTASISLNSVELSEFTSLSIKRIVVLTVVRTASMYLSSSKPLLGLVHKNRLVTIA